MHKQESFYDAVHCLEKCGVVEVGRIFTLLTWILLLERLPRGFKRVNYPNPDYTWVAIEFITRVYSKLFYREIFLTTKEIVEDEECGF